MSKNFSETTDPQLGSITADGKRSSFWECTNCRGMFKPELRHHELGDIEEDKAVVKYFVSCTHCQTEYVIHYTSNHVRELQARLRGMREDADHAAFKEALDALQIRMKDRGYPVNALFSGT